MQGTMAVFAGIGLSATCGFRIFVPLLGISIAHHTGHRNCAGSLDYLLHSSAGFSAESEDTIITFSIARREPAVTINKKYLTVDGVKLAYEEYVHGKIWLDSV